MILNRRILREFKDNIVRYASLFFLIFIGITIVVGMAASSDSIIYTVKTSSKANNVEDGAFSLYIPLDSNAINELNDIGAEIEECFYVDIKMKDGSLLRIFKNREHINLIDVNSGKAAYNKNEIVLEKNYARLHKYGIGDSVSILGGNYTITGTGSSPDYNLIKKNIADVAVDNEGFSVAFVSKESFDYLCKLSRNEVYNYSYLLKNDATANDIKEYLMDMEFDTNAITNEFFVEGLEEMEAEKSKFTDGVNELVDGTSEIKNGLSGLNDAANKLEDGSGELSDGINEVNEGLGEYKEGLSTFSDGLHEASDGADELASGISDLYDASKSLKSGLSNIRSGLDNLSDGTKNLSSGLEQLQQKNDDLNNAANKTFEGLLNMAESQFADMGISIDLTQDNYRSKLSSLKNSVKNSPAKVNAISSIIIQLDNYKVFMDGLKLYTEGVSSASIGAKDVDSGTNRISNSISSVNSAVGALNNGLGQADSGAKELSEGSKQLSDGSNQLITGIDSVVEANTQIADGAGELHENLGELKQGTSKLYGGSIKLNNGAKELQDGIDEFIDESFEFKYVNLSDFIKSIDNPRINDYEEDSMINKNAAMVVGIIFILLISYILSVFVVHIIERESAVIGTLYSMGYLKRELLKHFMILPVSVVSIGAILGTILGFQIIPFLAEENVNYYSYPELNIIYSKYLLAYGIVIPIVVVFIVNLFVISKKLSLEPLKLLRREMKVNKFNNVDLGNMGFLNRFRIRQILRESRGNITMFIGLFISILLLVFSFCISGSLERYAERVDDDIKYQYMYLLKYPLSDQPKNAEITYTKSLSCYFDLAGTDLSVALQGIEKNNRFFDFDVSDKPNEVSISDSVAMKFGFKVGDTIVLTDDFENTSYSFKVKEIVKFSNGLYIFMDIDEMRELFKVGDEYYNTLLSDEALKINENRILTVTKVGDIVETANSFVGLMSSMIIMILVVSVLLFVIVMYILLKMMIDRSTFSISLIKVFGYTNKEISKLYLGSSFYVVLAAVVFSIPISKLIINKVYPMLISNMASGMETYLSPTGYLEIIGIVMVSYFIVNSLLERHLRKVSLTEILKTRE